MFSLSCDGGAGVGSDCFCFSFYFCFSEMFRYCMLSTNNIHSVSNRLHSFGRLGLEGKIQTHVQQHSGSDTLFICRTYPGGRVHVLFLFPEVVTAVLL